MLATIMCIIQLQLKHKIGLNLEAEKHQAQNRQNHQALILFFVIIKKHLRFQMLMVFAEQVLEWEPP